jgi:hypothetical protein
MVPAPPSARANMKNIWVAVGELLYLIGLVPKSHLQASDGDFQRVQVRALQSYLEAA